MPNPARETVFAALFALTQNVTWGTPTPRTFITRARRVKLFSDVSQSLQPAIYQAEHTENFVQITRLPYKRVWNASWIVYQATGVEPGSVPAIENNLIMDALQDAMAPKPTDPGFPDQRNTLGGLVHHCYIEGDAFKDPGDIDNQGMIVVPIKILVP